MTGSILSTSAAQDDVGHADAGGVALGVVGQVADDRSAGSSAGSRARSRSIDAGDVAVDDVRVGAVAADVLADLVDDQDVERRSPGRRPIRSRAIRSSSCLAVPDLRGRDRLDQAEAAVAVLDQGDAEGDVDLAEGEAADGRDQVVEVGKPLAWKYSAPFCLPRPIAIIFIRPDSIGPTKSVWGLTRPTGMTTSACS